MQPCDRVAPRLLGGIEGGWYCFLFFFLVCAVWVSTGKMIGGGSCGTIGEGALRGSDLASAVMW